MAYDATRTAMTDAQKEAHIKAVVTQAGVALRERFPVLKHQDAIGAAILAASLLGMAGAAALYLAGMLPWYLTIPAVAIFASFTHELEHDLIHWMYFRRKPWAHHLMMGLAWLARASTINPWIRRGLHFNHHKVSGSEQDLEERAITNGERWGLLRLVMTGDNILSVLLRAHRAPSWALRRRLVGRALAAYFPLGWAFWGAWYAFLGVHLAGAAGVEWSAAAQARIAVLDALAVVYLLPNVLRTFCLHFVSSNMHYYGDLEPDNVIQQTQVLNPWWLWPAQLFCCNFGSTHAIHHFVVKEPFYVRQLTAPAAHRVMREMGVRFNDTGTFRRANRWAKAA
jgi:hypothetical protein